MKKSSFITRLSMLLASVVAIGGITFGVRYEYKEANAWSGNQTSTAPANYYSSCVGKEGSALQAELLSINKWNSKSYNWSRYEAADEAENDSSSIISVYTRHNIKKNAHVGGSYSWDTWNREHIWTQTKYPNSADDNHNIFACEGKINGIRNNDAYAELSHDESNRVVVFDHKTDCYSSGGYFEPCDEAKGEIARSVMYGTVMYSYRMTEIAKSVELMLKWHLEHPVTNRDVYRNNTVYSLQGNRNPFVDEPSYACKIWGNTNDATRALCSGSITPSKTLTSVVVSTAKTSVQVNREIQLTAIAKYSDNTEVDVTNSAIWKSSNDSYAIVANDGTVLGVGICDEVTITATFQERTGSVKLNVTEKPVIPTEPDKPGEDTPPSNKKGCKGSIISSSIILTLLAIIGITLVLFRKKKQH
ncbi:MAG: endonuclease [Clostridia bacterium]|nr:endonuclease [Clostridia bacterium]